jgi:membrane protein
VREHFSAWIGRWALGHAALGAQEGYTRHATSQFAAAISYRVLFSLVPLVSFVAAIADALLPDKQRDAVARWLAGVVPGQALDSSVEQALTGSRVGPTVAGVVSLAVLLWAASGMMGAIRIAFRVIWENDLRRTFVRSKLLDFVLVLGVGVVAVAAIGASLIAQVLAEIGHDLGETFGSGTSGRVLAAVTEVLASGAVTYGILVVLYRFVPPVRPPIRVIWLPALLATIGFHVATAVYALYLARFGDVTAVYGPLGAVLGFLLVVYVGVIVILLGAELVAAWPPPEARPVDDD